MTVEICTGSMSKRKKMEKKKKIHTPTGAQLSLSMLSNVRSKAEVA